MNPVFPESSRSETLSYGLRISAIRVQRLRQLLLLLVLSSFIGQLLLSQDWISITCSLLAATGAATVFHFMVRASKLLQYPLSSLMVLGFGVTLQLGPLLFTLLEGKSITFNLQVPVLTFGHSLLCSLLSVVLHAYYCCSLPLKQIRTRFQGLLHQLKIFQPLQWREVMIMGACGCVAISITNWFSGLFQETPVIKFIQGFQFLAVIPVVFVLRPLWQSGKNRIAEYIPQRAWLTFIGFLILTVIIGIGRNSRATFVVPLACFVLGLVCEWIYGLIRIRLSLLLGIVLAVLIGLPLMTDLATAMVMVRGQRADVSTFVLFDQTLQQMQDRESIHRYRQAISEIVTSGWDETYVSNLFLSRFANVKYPDNALENSLRLSQTQGEQMAEFQWLRFLATFPAPLLDFVGISTATKEEINSRSFGDQLYYLASGNRYALGGFRTGHFFGTGMAGFGYGYLLLFSLALLLIFSLIDSLVMASSGSIPVFSAVAITQLISWFTFSNSESVSSMFSFVLRGYIEPILLFYLVRKLIRTFVPVL